MIYQSLHFLSDVSDLDLDPQSCQFTRSACPHGIAWKGPRGRLAYNAMLLLPDVDADTDDVAYAIFEKISERTSGGGCRGIARVLDRRRGRDSSEVSGRVSSNEE